ncbi:MAG TPA: hypothetical protein VFI00_22515 [Kribbella sp.]|nr:hypothetical protein [Kribbella sp.]
MLAVAAGCSGTPEQTPIASSPSSTGTPSAPAPASSVPPQGPLGSSAYQAELTKIEKTLAGPLRTLTRVRTAEGLTEAMTTLAESLDAASSQLADFTVTARLTGVHEVLQDRLGTAAETLSNSDQTEANARCGGVAYTSQKVQRKLRADLNGAIVPLTRLKLKFGGTLPDPGPEPKTERPSNGDVVIRSGPSGTGRLKVTNGTANDVAVSIVTDGKPPSEPHVMTYIQAGKTTTISRIGGAYHIYFKSGSDWIPDRRQFGEDCAFQKFDQAFGRNEGWQVNLEPTLGGNAKTTEVEAY